MSVRRKNQVHPIGEDSRGQESRTQGRNEEGGTSNTEIEVDNGEEEEKDKEMDTGDPEVTARLQQMMAALDADNVEDVKSLLTNFQTEDFPVRDLLLQLYDEKAKNKPVIGDLLERIGKSPKQKPLKHIGRLLSDLMGEYYDSHHLGIKKQDDFKEKVDPTQELFLWCVLTNQHNLADFFWERISEPMAAALVATRLLESLMDRSESKQHKKKLENKAKEFAARAESLLNECYQENPEMTQKLLTRKLPKWGSSSCCMIALWSANKSFISEPACKDMLDSIWTGHLAESTRYWKILFSIVFFPLIVCWISFKKTGSASCVQKLYNFYHAPVVIYFVNLMTHLAFLAVYSYLLVVQLSPDFHWLEPVVAVWAYTIYEAEHKFLANPVENNLRRSIWVKILDIYSSTLWFWGLILRSVVTHCANCYHWGRVLLALSLTGCFLRMLSMFCIHPQLGPKIIMIGKMIADLKPFTLILLVFVASYAIASEAILYPNTALSWKLLYYLPRKAYWHIYGELFLDTIEGDDPVEPCTDDPALYTDYSQPRCPSPVGQWLVPVLLGLYILVTNVLLLNLLIAMFSSTYQAVEKDARKLGHFLMFEMIYDYSTRPALPPPFIIISRYDNNRASRYYHSNRDGNRRNNNYSYDHNNYNTYTYNNRRYNSNARRYNYRYHNGDSEIGHVFKRNTYDYNRYNTTNPEFRRVVTNNKNFSERDGRYWSGWRQRHPMNNYWQETGRGFY